MWTDADDTQSRESLDEAVRLGCTFFDTAWSYGRGHSERLLGELVRRHPARRLHTASKIPPRNLVWPARAGTSLDYAFPPEHIREYTERTIENLALPRVDLMQFHVWDDAWARDDRWRRAMDDLRREGLIGGVGISVNTWEPANVLETLRTGAVDAVQVVYNIFEQSPEDELFPLCREMNIAVIARVPFDEGSLGGAITRDSRWSEGDFRNSYFAPRNLERTLERVDAIRAELPEGATLPEIALRFVLSNPVVSTVIPGMRRQRHVRANIAASDAGPLPPALLERLRAHRWDRSLAEWGVG
jgi:aryl-alcohol dehydrogenase-like predicted oxidoreductase